MTENKDFENYLQSLSPIIFFCNKDDRKRLCKLISKENIIIKGVDFVKKGEVIPLSRDRLLEKVEEDYG